MVGAAGEGEGGQCVFFFFFFLHIVIGQDVGSF